MTFRIFAAFFAVLVLLFPGLAKADTIGTVVEIEGTATISRGGGAPFALKLNDTVGMGDILATGEKSRLFVLLADNTEWTLAENSRFRVDEYLFDSEDTTSNKARYSVLQGGFRYVSGLVAKKENPDVSINSPAGTIGIRGTDITVAPDTDGSYDVYVDDGTIDVASGGGNTRLQRGQGTMIAKRGAAPLAPKDWKQGRLQRLREHLKLARGGEIRGRIQQMQPKQMELRKKLRERLQERKGLKKEGMNREQKQELRKEKAEQRKAAVQQRRSETETRRERWNEKSNEDDAGTREQRQRRLKALQQRIQR
ncbi:MAG: toxins-related Ca2+-binding protein [Alphaproteobacteria bacterium]|jgi:hypothetical protein|nr:toxins-related Ca2+-binding protein [Alphaproteobacteria bacterium]